MIKIETDNGIEYMDNLKTSVCFVEDESILIIDFDRYASEIIDDLKEENALVELGGIQDKIDLDLEVIKKRMLEKVSEYCDNNGVW